VSLSREAVSHYEASFVPVLFGPWAEEVADAAGVARGQCVLDLACGTGVLARAVAERLEGSGRVTGLDPDPAMLAVAAHEAPALDWREGEAEALPFADATFDVVVSQFGLTFFRDPDAALREVRRVLRPRGRAVFAVWAALEDMPAYVAFVTLLERLFGAEVAARLRGPFAMGDAERLVSRFREAGFDDVERTTRRRTARFRSLEAWIEADARGWLELDAERHAELLAAAPEALAAFVAPDGGARIEMVAHVVTAVAPPRSSSLE
jgi:ubiquinone/menaquinone biosynthesis C-methylase UbiE